MRISQTGRSIGKNVVVFVEDSKATARQFIVRKKAELALKFKEVGYNFLYIPDLVENLDSDVLGYLCPGQSESVTAEAIYARIRYGTALKDVSGFLYRGMSDSHFLPLSGLTDGEMEKAVDGLVMVLEHSLEQDLAESRQRIREKWQRRIQVGYPERRKRESQVFGSQMKSVSMDCECRYTTREIPSSVDYLEEIPLPPDPRTAGILEAWDKIVKDFGITIDDLYIYLAYKVKFSKMKITKAGKIFLTDYGNREVKMDDLTKAIYFYYLRHPEGMRLKELQAHETEILHIYMGITGRDNVEAIKQSVHNHLDPYGNGINVSLSRIKKAFKDIVNDDIAVFYYITGRSGEDRSVKVDRDLVIWEH